MPQPALFGNRKRKFFSAIRVGVVLFLVLIVGANYHLISSFRKPTDLSASAVSPPIPSPATVVEDVEPSPLPAEDSPLVEPVSSPDVPVVAPGRPDAMSLWLNKGNEQPAPVGVPVRRIRQRIRRNPVESQPSVSPVALPSSLPASADTSSLTAFVNSGGHLPIVVMTRDRTLDLSRSLSSLLSVRGVTREAVFVVQDGTNEPTKEVVDSFGLRCHQKSMEGPKLRGGAADVAAARIAQHFRYALEYMFDTVTNAPGIIIVEDDFLYSPDFYEYFHFVAPVLEQDTSLFLASSWNDNGFVGVTKDPAALRRTSYFPGLGWLLPRRLFNDELRSKWPAKHWDHWLREVKQHKNRDILVPEVPRVFHAGVKGTFMDQKTHDKYFARIATNQDGSFRWSDPDGSQRELVKQDMYRQRLRDEVKSARVLSTVEDVLNFRSGVGAVFYTNKQRPVAFEKNNFRHIAAYFQIWHEPIRGSRDGVHRIHWNDGVIFLINTARCTEMTDLFPGAAAEISLAAFDGVKSPIPLQRNDGHDPITELQGSVLPPLPPIHPNSPLFASAAIRSTA